MHWTKAPHAHEILRVSASLRKRHIHDPSRSLPFPDVSLQHDSLNKQRTCNSLFLYLTILSMPEKVLFTGTQWGQYLQCTYWRWAPWGATAATLKHQQIWCFKGTCLSFYNAHLNRSKHRQLSGNFKQFLQFHHQSPLLRCQVILHGCQYQSIKSMWKTTNAMPTWSLSRNSHAYNKHV